MYHGSIPSEDLEKDAKFLDLTKEQLVEKYLIKNAVEVCPVAFEIYERLKKEYGFRFR